MNNTSIEWTDATWNPLRGCSRVSEGCRHCYAERVALRFSAPGQAYAGLAVLQNGHASWTGKVELVEKHLLDPLRMRRPQRIFVNSMSDLFHESVPGEWIDRIFAVMALCPQHTFQVLTKRPERMLAYFAKPSKVGFTSREGYIQNAVYTIKPDAHFRLSSWPLPNVWLGVSVEHQVAADQRIPLLLQTPAAVRFISAEPLLGPVQLDRLVVDVGSPGLPNGAYIDSIGDYRFNGAITRLDWVIAGGESGPGARPMHPDWVRSLRDQCLRAGTAFFFKQWGETGPARLVHIDGCVDKTNGRYHWEADPTGKGAPRTIGKKAAGHLLDGVAHQAFPATGHQTRAAGEGPA